MLDLVLQARRPFRMATLLVAVIACTTLVVTGSVSANAATTAPAETNGGGAHISGPASPVATHREDRRLVVVARVQGAPSALPGVVVVRSLAAEGEGGLSAAVAGTFKNGEYATRTLSEDLVVERWYGGTSGQLGSYWTRTTYSTAGRARQYLALPPGNTAEDVVSIRVPAGTTIYEGKAAGVPGMLGGGNQIYIPEVDPGWLGQ